MWQPGYSAKASLNFWLLVLTCASASAADLAPATPLPPLPWAQASWTGFYVGVGGGFSSLNKRSARPRSIFASFSVLERARREWRVGND
jgi:hypothetical protein